MLSAFAGARRSRSLRRLSVLFGKPLLRHWWRRRFPKKFSIDLVPGGRRRKAEADAAEWEAQRRRREEERARLQEDDDRWSRLTEAAGRWRDVAEIQSFLAALKSLPIDPLEQIEERPIIEWIGWAEKRLSRSDPLRNGVGVFFEKLPETK